MHTHAHARMHTHTHVRSYLTVRFRAPQKCSNIADYFQTNIDLACAQDMPPVFEYMRSAANSGRSLPPTRMTNVDVDRAFIGEGSLLVGGRIARSVIGTNSYIGSNCDIEESIVNGLSVFHTQVRLA